MNPINQPSQPHSFSHLHRWIWGELRNGDILPVGGSIFSPVLTTNLKLDYDAFPAFAKWEDLNRLYASRKDVFEVWYRKFPEGVRKNVDPKLFFALMTVQNGMEQRLGIAADELAGATGIRNAKYADSTPKLSDFRDGSAQCAERAALWQGILRSIGIPSVYMSGVSFHTDVAEGGDHSWIVLHPDTDQSIIYDIARPGKNRLPNLYKSESPISKEIFEGQDNAFIEAKKLLGSSSRFFGVSDHPNMITEIGYVVKSYVSTNLMPL